MPLGKEYKITKSSELYDLIIQPDGQDLINGAQGSKTITGGPYKEIHLINGHGEWILTGQ